jgi:hypothetical protein
MDMVRHDHVTTNGDVEVALGTLGKKDECCMKLVPRQKRPSLVCAKGDEIERARVKNAIETRRTLSEISFHAKTCSHGPVGRRMQTFGR